MDVYGVLERVVIGKLWIWNYCVLMEVK